MSKRILKISVIFILAFAAGFILRAHLNKGLDHGQDIKIGGQIFKPIAYRNTDQHDMPDDTKKVYHDLIAEYFSYIKGEDEKDRISFKDFVSIRRDQLIQQEKYTAEDERMERQVLEWYNKLNEINRIPGYEVNTYHVYGTIIPPTKGQSLCALGDRKYLNILVGAYLNQPSDDLLPAVPNGSIDPEQPLDYNMVDCANGNFELSFVLGNQMELESPPVYIIAYVFSDSPHNHLVPIAIGTDEKVNGIPPSILSKRKTNRPMSIKLHHLKDSQMSADININTSKGVLTTPYGLDSIVTFLPDFNMFRTTISSADGVARLKALPLHSNILFEMTDKNNNKSFVVTPTSSNLIDITLPDYSNNKDNSLVIVPPSSIKEGEILLFSKTNKNKFSFPFNNQERKPIFLNNLSKVETFLELRTNDLSMGLMPVTIKNDAVSVVEPAPKHIERIIGKISLINSPIAPPAPCKGCTISIKYTDRIAGTNLLGNFSLDDVNIIDNQAEIDIEASNMSFIYPLVLHNQLRALHLDISLPSKSLLSSWNQLFPTIPGHSIIYGEYPKNSFHAFIVGTNNNDSAEASYFDKAVMPTKEARVSPYEPDSAGFGKFIFPDVKPGDYVLYIISSDKIIHARMIRVEAGKITLIN